MGIKRFIEQVDWSAIGWAVAIFVCYWLILTPTHAAGLDLKQDTLGYCEARAGLAKQIIESIDGGLGIEHINIAFVGAAESDEMAEARELWTEALKQESADAHAAMQGRDERIQRATQLVIEKCWRDYGKRRTEKRATVPVGLIRVASSEALVKPDRVGECSALLVDQLYIGNMLGSGQATVPELREIALKSSAKLGPARFDKVMKLLDEVKLAMQKNGLQAWFNDYWHVCTDGG